LAGYLLAKRAAGRAPATIDCYVTRLGRMIAFLGDPHLARVTTDELRRWLIALKEGHDGRETSGVYVEGHRIVADGFFTWAVRERHLKRSPMDAVERFKSDRPQIRTLTLTEIDALLEEQPGTHEGMRNRAMLALMYDTGVRVGELVRMDLDDVDLEAGEARIHGKNRAIETVPLSMKLRSILWTYITRARPRELFAGTARLFVSRDGSALTTNAVRLWMRRAKLRVGIAPGKRVSPHVIRASFATHYAANGGDAFTLQKILRHRTRDMVDRYVAVGKSDIARQHAISSPLSRLGA